MRTLHLSTAKVRHIARLRSYISLSDRPVYPPYVRKAESALRESIDQLSPREKQELEAIAWLGRRDFDKFDEALSYAEIAANGGIFMHLANKETLAYLEQGARLLPEQGIQLA